jgi:polyphosphate kinase 2
MSKSQKPDLKSEYKSALPRLQLAMVRFQQAAMESGERAVIVFEGRDAAGKDGTIARVIEHLSPRITRIAALPKPSDRERTQWYFQRYSAHLPAESELVLFNRSWYNRAGVEPVMGFCTAKEHQRFLEDVPVFEAMLVESGVKLVKIWLDITKKEQAVRLEGRRTDPLKALKTSALDAEAQKRWSDYSDARNEMLTRSHTAIAPWVCVQADHKKATRLNVLRHIIRTIAPKNIAKDFEVPDPKVLFPFEPAALSDGRLAP